MKFRLTFKTNDVLESAIDPYLDTHCETCEEHDSECLACNNLEESSLEKIEEIRDCAEKFIKYGELITIEFNTESQTATAVTAK
jgi:hypothetical protein